MVTVLSAANNQNTTKVLNAQLEFLPIQMPVLFNVRIEALSSLRELSDLLTRLEGDPTSCITRWTLRLGRRAEGVRRVAKTADSPFVDEPQRWLWIDIDQLELPSDMEDFNDNPEDVVRFACSHLPIEFRDVDCHWQFSASMGIKPGIRLHLAYVLDRPVSSREARTWLQKASTPIDLSIFNSVQALFTASPIFEVGAIDPVRQRSGLLQLGHGDTIVGVPKNLSSEAQVVRSTPHVRNVDGQQHLDPEVVVRDERGIVVDGRETFMFMKSVEAVRELTRGGRETNDHELTSSTWAKFAAEAELSDRKWSIADARQKARARLADIDRGHNFNARTTEISLVPEVPAYHQLEPVSVNEGLTKLDGNLRSFFERARLGEQICQVERVTMGSGKTRSMLETLKAHYDEKPDSRVSIYVARHDLAEALSDQLQQWSDSTNRMIGIRHVRGMVAEADELSLCRRAPFVRSLAGNGHSVRPIACYRDQDKQCEHYSTCSYWNQFRFGDFNVGSISIYAHANLKFPRQVEEPTPDLVIIDEGILGTIHEEHRLPLDVVRRQFFPTANGTVGDVVANGIRDGQPVLDLLRQHHVDEFWLDEIVNERSESYEFVASGNDLPQTLANTTSTRAKRALASVLIEELGLSDRQYPTRVRYDESTNEVVVNRLHDLQIPDAASVLVLDATADERLIRQIFKGRGEVVFHRIDIEQKLSVTQVWDRTGSNAFWNSISDEEHEGLVLLMNEYVYAGHKVLCVSHKAMADRLRTMGLNENVYIEHFGNLRGSNDFEDCDVAFVTGRHQPRHADIEGLARAVWWDDVVPLKFDTDGAFRQSSALPLEVRGYLMSDSGEQHGVYVRCFSDERIEACQQQLREAETVQALARIRAVHSPRKKKVFLLGNLPVEVPVDELVKWRDLMPDKAERVLIKFGSVPTSMIGLRTMLGDAYPTESMSRDAKHRTRLRDPKSLLQMSPDAIRATLFEVEFQTVKDGKASGRRHRHIFRADLDAERGGCRKIDLHLGRWRSTLENGYDGLGSGWGPIKIVGIRQLNPEYVPVPIPHEEVVDTGVKLADKASKTPVHSMPSPTLSKPVHDRPSAF